MGSAYNSKHQKMPPFAHRTLGELPSNSHRTPAETVTTPPKQRDEGFVGGLPTRNVRMFRHGAGAVLCMAGSRGMAVDRLWITHGDFSTCPVNAFNGRLAGFRAVWLPYPHPCTENVTTGRETSPRGGGGGLPRGGNGAGNGIAWAKKTPRMAGQEKTPRISPWGCGGLRVS